VLSPSTYNRHVRCRRSACPFRIRHAEQLVAYPRAYPHTGGATAGCVSLPSSRVVWMLRRMKPGAVVSIGVGSAAYAPLHACLTW
jgi:hypothetical protein